MIVRCDQCMGIYENGRRFNHARRVPSLCPSCRSSSEVFPAHREEPRERERGRDPDPITHDFTVPVQHEESFEGGGGTFGGGGASDSWSDSSSDSSGSGGDSGGGGGDSGGGGGDSGGGSSE